MERLRVRRGEFTQIYLHFVSDLLLEGNAFAGLFHSFFYTNSIETLLTTPAQSALWRKNETAQKLQGSVIIILTPFNKGILCTWPKACQCHTYEQRDELSRFCVINQPEDHNEVNVVDRTDCSRRENSSRTIFLGLAVSNTCSLGFEVAWSWHWLWKSLVCSSFWINQLLLRLLLEDLLCNAVRCAWNGYECVVFTQSAGWREWMERE